MYRRELIIFFHLTAAKSRLVQPSVSSRFGLHCGFSTGSLAILLHPHWFFHCVCQFGILVSCHQLACTEQEDTLTVCFFCAGKCGVIMRTFISNVIYNDRTLINKKNSHNIRLIVRFWMFSPTSPSCCQCAFLRPLHAFKAEWVDS